MREDLFLRIGPGGVDHDQRLLVAPAVADRIELAVVGRERRHLDLGLVVGGDDGLELARFVRAVQHDRVQPFAAVGQAHLPGMVGAPADDVAGVACHQGFLARAQVDAVDVEDLGIATVVADEDVVRVVGQVVHQVGADLVAGCQVGDLAGADIHRDDVEVLVAAEVLRVQDAVAALPVVDADVARGLGRQASRLAHRLAALQALDEDVQAARRAVDGDRLHEPERATVLAQPEVRLLGVAEEVAHGVGLGYGLHRGLRHGRRGQCESKAERRTHEHKRQWQGRPLLHLHRRSCIESRGAVQ